jgi:hypothetical protein
MTIPYRGTTFAATYFVAAGTSFKKNLLQSDRFLDRRVRDAVEPEKYRTYIHPESG